MAESETIADIVAEKRRDAQHIRNNLSTVPVRRLDQLAEIKSLADEADRLEAAHKRERGDCAKLREALVKARRFIDSSPLVCIVDDTGTIARGELCAEIDAALAATPRNCDRFATVDEARKAHEAICEKYGKCHHGCPLNNEEHYSAFDCFEAWLFAPATEKEGGAK